MEFLTGFTKKLSATFNMPEENVWAGFIDGLLQLSGKKPLAWNTSSMAPMMRVAEALADLDAKHAKGYDMDVVERGYSRALRQAIETNDGLLAVEALKGIGDLHLEIGKKTHDERSLIYAFLLYSKAVLHCRDDFVWLTLYHRVNHTAKYMTQPPLSCIAQDRFWYSNVSEDSDTCMSRVAEILQDLDLQRLQGYGNDALIEGYTMVADRAAVYTDVMTGIEAKKTIGDIYLEHGRANKDTKYVSKASAAYKSLLQCFYSKLVKNESMKVCLEHRIEYAGKVLRRLEKAISSSRNHKDVQSKETRPYAELHLAGDSALQNGDLDAAEGHFVSALKQIHSQQSPRVQEEEECLRKLGTVYVRRGVQTKDGQDFAKATALYNAALARGGNKHVLVDAIKKAERLFLSHTAGVNREPSPYDTDIEHKILLEKYRAEVKVRLETIHNNYNPYQYDEDDPIVKEVEIKRAESVKDLFKGISKQRKDFIKDLVNECIGAIGPPPCQYAIVGLGSQATELVTPYSDLEFAILIEENKDTPGNRQYFVNLTLYLYLKIINLGETILPAMGIKSLNDFQSEDPEDSWFYDSVTPRGFAFDGTMPWASKTPFGRESTKTKPAVSLIQTPAGMAEFQHHDIAIAHGYHLSSILRHVSFLTGHETLVKDYRKRIIYELYSFDEQSKTTAAARFARASLAHTLKEHWGQKPTSKVLDVKKGIYRFPTVAVVNLGLLWRVYGASVWDVIHVMKEAGLVTAENAHHLQVLVSISGELRLRTYLELGGQKENLSGLSAVRKQHDERSEILIKSVFHVPDQKMLFRYYYTAHPLKKSIITIILTSFANSPTTHLGQETFYDDSPPVKADICQGLLQFTAAIAHTEDALRELDVDKVAKTGLPGQSQEVNHYSKVSLLGQKAEIYRRLGDPRKAISSWEEQLKEQQLYRSDPKTVFTYSNIIMALGRLGEEGKALANIKQALSLNKDVLCKDPETAALLDDITAMECSEHHNLDKAQLVSYLEKLLNKILCGEHPAAPVIPGLLPQLLGYFNIIGDSTKAITYIEESLKIMKTVYGQDTAHPDIAEALTNLGISFCRGLNDHTKAIRYYEDALEMYKVVYVSDKPHPATADSLNKLGVEWLHLGEYKKARIYLEQASQMLIHGGDEACQPDILHVVQNLQLLFGDDMSRDYNDVVGDNADARACIELILKMYQELCGSISHSRYNVTLLVALGELAERTGDNLKAIGFYERALKMTKELPGKCIENSDFALVLVKLGSACRKEGEYQKALQYCQRAQEVLKDIHGQKAAHYTIAESLGNLAVIYDKLGDHTKAIQLNEDVLSMAKVTHGGSETHGGDEARHPDIAGVLHNLGCLWCDVGDYEKARVFFEQALKMYQDIYGTTTPHEDIAIALNGMGAVLAKSGQDSDAIRFFEEALTMMEKVLGNNKEHSHIAAVLGNLGSACRKTGQYTKSIGYYKRALEVNKGIHGQDAAHRSIAATLRGIAAVYIDVGDHTKAAQLYEEALNMLEIIHGAKETRGGDEARHPDIAGVLHNLGCLWCDVGDYEKARVFFEQALKMYQDIYGPTTPHKDTANALNGMGAVLAKSGQNSDAISFFEEALTMMEKVLSNNKLHPHIAGVLSNLGSVCRKAGEHKKSLKYYERALEINKCIHRQEVVHPSISASPCNLASVHEDLGEHSKAIQLYQDALKMTKLIHGANKTHERDEVCHPDIARLLRNLGSLWHIVGENEKALSFCEQALKMNRELYGPTTPHRDTAMVLLTMGAVFEKSGDHPKAISCYEEILKMEEIFVKSKEHHVIASLLAFLGSACRKTAEYEKALQYYQRALETNKGIHGQDATHPAIAESLRNLGEAYEDVGNYSTALQLNKDALSMLKVIHGANATNGGDNVSHPDIAGVFKDIGSLCIAVDDNEEARTFLEKALGMYQELYGPNTPHPHTTVALANMGRVLEKAGDNLKAISFYEKALLMIEEILGKSEEHHVIAPLLVSLGSACHKTGEYRRSLQYYERVLEINKGIHGQDAVHPSIAESLCYLAEVYRDLGDLTKAAQFYEDALNMTKTIHGANQTHGREEARHQDIAGILNSLGCVWDDVGDNEKASAFWDQALKMYQELYGPTTPHRDTAMVLTNLGIAWHKAEENQKSLQYCEDALNMLKTIHGANQTHGGEETSHPDIARILAALGSLWDDVGDNKKAREFWEQALKMYQELYGPTTPHRDTAMVLKIMGVACYKAGENQKSLQYCERALGTIEGLDREDSGNPDIARYLRQLATVYEDHGNYTKAIQLNEDALNMLKTIHGANETGGGDEVRHPDIADILNRLGCLWYDVGDNEKATAFWEQALKMYQELYGPTTPHHDTALVLYNMGIAFLKSGDNFKAITSFEEALKMMEEMLCREHPDIVDVLGKLGSACYVAGEYKKSLQHCERALAIIKGLDREDSGNPDIARYIRQLATVYKDHGNYTKAAQLNEDALNMLKTIYGANKTGGGEEVRHPDIADNLHNLGCLWEEVGDNEKARAFWEQALKMYQELHGPTTPHHDTALALNNLGVSFVKSGDNLKAISFYEEALKMMEGVLGQSKKHPHIALVLGNFGSAFNKAGEHTKSLQYCKRALAMIEGLPEKDAAAPAIATTLSELAAVYEDIKDYTKAIQLYEDALVRIKTLHGANKTHPKILKLLDKLETVCNKAGHREKANGYHEQAQVLKTAVEEREGDNDITQPKGVE